MRETTRIQAYHPDRNQVLPRQGALVACGGMEGMDACLAFVGVPVPPGAILAAVPAVC